MEQTTNLKQTVEKLDCALRRLQEVQSALRGHSTLSLNDSDKIPEPNRFNGCENHLVPSGSQRRWSMPTPLTHDALSDVVAVDKFAKKTVDMVKVQKKKHLAAHSINTSSFCPSQTGKTSILRSSNRTNLPQPVINMSASNEVDWKPKTSAKENKRTPSSSHKSKSKDDAKDVHTEVGFRSTLLAEDYDHGKSKGAPKTSSKAEKRDMRVYATTIAPEEDVKSDIIKLRALMHVEEATTDPLGHVNGRDEGERKVHDHNAAAKRSSLSMRTLMRMEDQEKNHVKQAVSKEGEEADPFTSAMASKSFSVQLEGIKSSRKKPWNFPQQGKTSDKLVVMFPNPTFDNTTPPTTTPPEDCQKAIASKKPFLHDTTPTIPFSNTMRSEARPSDSKGSSQKREKIVRLSPCTISTSCVQKPKTQVAPAVDMRASASKQEASAVKKQKWRCTLTQQPTPTLIRRLPQAHEMIGIKRTTLAFMEEEEKHSVPKNYTDDGPDSLTRSWSFGSPSVHGSSWTSFEARRASLNPSGSQPFSFLSKHFKAWKLTSKHNK